MQFDPLKILEAITNGELDDQLQILGAAIELRYEEKNNGEQFFLVTSGAPATNAKPSTSPAKLKFYPGQKVKFTNTVRPKYLAHVEASVVKVKRVTVDIKLKPLTVGQTTIGRFPVGKSINVNHTLIEPV